jgi:hypothetical protein
MRARVPGRSESKLAPTPAHERVPRPHQTTTPTGNRHRKEHHQPHERCCFRRHRHRQRRVRPDTRRPKRSDVQIQAVPGRDQRHDHQAGDRRGSSNEPSPVPHLIPPGRAGQVHKQQDRQQRNRDQFAAATPGVTRHREPGLFKHRRAAEQVAKLNRHEECTHPSHRAEHTKSLANSHRPTTRSCRNRLGITDHPMQKQPRGPNSHEAHHDDAPNEFMPLPSPKVGDEMTVDSNQHRLQCLRCSRRWGWLREEVSGASLRWGMWRSAAGRRNRVWKWAGMSFSTSAGIWIGSGARNGTTGAQLVPKPKRIECPWLLSWTLLQDRVKPSTAASHEPNLRHHGLPSLGRIRLTSLRAEHLNRLYARLLQEGRIDGQGGLSSNTVRNVHVIVRPFLRDACSAGLVSRNVAELATPPPRRSPRTAPAVPRSSAGRASGGGLAPGCSHRNATRQDRSAAMGRHRRRQPACLHPTDQGSDRDRDGPQLTQKRMRPPHRFAHRDNTTSRRAWRTSKTRWREARCGQP